MNILKKETDTIYLLYVLTILYQYAKKARLKRRHPFGRLLFYFRARDGAQGPVDLGFARTGVERRYSNLRALAGLVSNKKDILPDVLLFELERETGLEPAASTLARSRSTN